MEINEFFCDIDIDSEECKITCLFVDIKYEIYLF